MASETETTSFGEYLTLQYEVLRRVLAYLPCSDLRSCSQVNKSWNKTCGIVLKKRRQIQCFWSNGKTSKCPDLCNAELTVSFSSARGKKRYEQFFASEKVLDFYSADGVIFKTNPHEPRRRIARNSETYTGVRFPKWKGVIIKEFSYEANWSEDDFAAAITMPGGAQIKAALFVDCQHICDFYKVNECYTILKKRNGECAIAGCVLSADTNAGAEETSAKWIIFAGENVEAASCVRPLNYSYSGAVEFGKKLSELRKCNVPLDQSLLFTFHEPESHSDLECARERNALTLLFSPVPIVESYCEWVYGADSPSDCFHNYRSFSFNNECSFLWIGFKN